MRLRLSETIARSVIRGDKQFRLTVVVEIDQSGRRCITRDETFPALENGDWFLTGVFAFGVVVVGYCGFQITESCVNTLQQDL